MFFRILDKLEIGLLSIIIASMSLFVFYEIIARAFFNYGILWSDELVSILNSYLVLVGAAYCTKEKSHIGIDLLVNKLNPINKKRAIRISLVAALVYSFLFLYSSIKYVYQDYTIGIDLDDLPIPSWTASLVLVIGFLLITIRFLQALYYSFSSKYYDNFKYKNIELKEHLENK